MSLILPDQRAGYKLIPQSNSEDSELSEEELDNLYKDGFQIITKKHVNLENRRKHIHSVNQKATKMSSENFDLKAEKIFPTNREHVTYELTTMSFERKICLILSILLCFFTIAGFIMLPCECGNCSCSEVLEENRHMWLNVFSSIEIKGAINLIENMFGNHYDLLFMACGSMFADSPIFRSDLISPSGGDIIVLNGLSGKQIWRKHFNNMPIEADCSLIYNKNNSNNECIMVGHGNYIALISSNEGKLIWNFAGTSGKRNRTYYQFPVILPDLDGDEVREIATIKDSNRIVLLSGLSGSSLLNNLTNQDCTEITQLKYIEKLSLSYLCKLKNDTNKLVIVALKHYLNILPTTKKNVRVPQHKSHPSQENFVNGHRIVVNNKGMLCPNNCTSEINIFDENNKTVWSSELLDSFVMKPNIFSLNDSGLYGFIFKIWEHEHEKNDPKKLKILQHRSKFTVGYIHERTIALVFNSTFNESLQIINMSSNAILQLCDSHKILQPDPRFQEDSTLIFDLNKNGSYKLVTYYSTFEEIKWTENDYHNVFYSKNPYILKSYIKMYDLNKEILKKLFDVVL